ncbi:MAG: MoxR family ATPase [Nitriliruptoraceae bacterium]|nr:MoxR family ATPase [Nitriliruptoraceae bacterium]
MQMQPDQATWFASTFGHLVGNVEQAIRGKTHTVRLAMTCLLSGGHLLLEDVPGTGKTILARSMAAVVQGSHHRIQFTPDLLPADVTGVTIYNQGTGGFDFHQGPIFANIVLADEINRSSPKTQSALLEVMEEGRVSVDGVSHEVPQPFMVVATMNPVEQAGTYDLPEAQLDRFLMKTSLGYPDRATTIELLGDERSGNRSAYVQPMITGQSVLDMVELASRVHADESVLGYVAEIADATRNADETDLGVSIRGCLALVRCAKTWAASQGRTHVVPDDIKQLVRPVFEHRCLLNPDATFAGVTVPQILDRILDTVTPPTGVAA